MPASTLRWTTIAPSASLFFVIGPRRPAFAPASVPNTPTILPSSSPHPRAASTDVPPRPPLLNQSGQVPDVQPRESQPLGVEEDGPQLAVGGDQARLQLEGVGIYGREEPDEQDVVRDDGGE